MQLMTIEELEQWMLGAQRGSPAVYLKDATGAHTGIVRGPAAYARALEQMGLVLLTQRRVTSAPTGGTFDYIATRTGVHAGRKEAERAKFLTIEEVGYA